MLQTRLLALSVLLVSVSTLPVWLVGASLFKIGTEFGLSAFHFGFLTAGFFLTASVSSLLVGHRIPRFGWQKAMRLNVIVTGGLLLLFATTVRSLATMVVLLVVAAAAYGISNPAANLALALHTSPGRTGVVFGIKHAGIPFSTLLAGLAVPALVVDHGWRWAFGAGVLPAIAVWFLIPRGEVARVERSGSLPAGRSVLETSDIYMLAAVSAFATWAATALGTFMVSGAMSVGFPEKQAGWIQFGGSALSILARVGYGWLSDRFRWGGFVAIGMLSATGGGMFLALPGVIGRWFVVVTLATYVTGWAWPGLLTSTVVGANREAAAGSSAITQAGVFVGAAFGPVVLGALIDRGGFPAAWRITGSSLLLSATLTLLLGARIRRRDGAQVEPR